MIRKISPQPNEKAATVERNLVRSLLAKIRVRSRELANSKKEHSPRAFAQSSDRLGQHWRIGYRRRRGRAVSTPSPAETPVTKIRLPWRFTPDSTSSVVEVAPNTFAISCSCFSKNSE